MCFATYLSNIIKYHKSRRKLKSYNRPKQVLRWRRAWRLSNTTALKHVSNLLALFWIPKSLMNQVYGDSLRFVLFTIFTRHESRWIYRSGWGRERPIFWNGYFFPFAGVPAYLHRPFVPSSSDAPLASTSYSHVLLCGIIICRMAIPNDIPCSELSLSAAFRRPERRPAIVCGRGVKSSKANMSYEVTEAGHLKLKDAP